MMTRITAVLVLALVLAMPAVAGAQSAPSSPTVKLAYQDGDSNGMPKWQLGVSYWFASGAWKFTNNDASATSRLITLDLKYNFSGPWSLAAEYSFNGIWSGITFSGVAAPSTVSGSENIASIDLRYRVGWGGFPTDLILGWQGFYTGTYESVSRNGDEARASGYRIGLESTYSFNEKWSVRGLLTWAPSMGVTETYNSPFQNVQTFYKGPMTDFRLAVGYMISETWKAELGWRRTFVSFKRDEVPALNRPADTLDHSLQGVFVNVVYRR